MAPASRESASRRAPRRRAQNSPQNAPQARRRIDAAPPTKRQFAPAAVAALVGVGASLAIIGSLSPGYWINDDLKIAWLLAGYPGSGGPSQFPVYSNVLLGLALFPLFTIAGALNWFTILTSLTITLSTVTLLYVASSRPEPVHWRALKYAAVLLTVALFIFELTYTIGAFLAALAGVCLIWLSNRERGLRPIPAIFGAGLIVLGSLIRLQMLAVAIAIALPSLILATANRRRLVLALVAVGVAVLAAYGVGRIYLRDHADWNTFRAYTDVRQSLHDSHRLFNVHREIRRVGWSANDQELFARWFFPDQALYSYEHLSYLRIHVPPESQNPRATLLEWFPAMVGGRNLAYVVFLLGIMALASTGRRPFHMMFALVAPVIATVAINAGFAVFYKNPDYVQACTLAAAILIVVCLLNVGSKSPLAGTWPWHRPRDAQKHLGLAGMAMTVIGAFLISGMLLRESRSNQIRRMEYASIRADLQALQAQGILPQGALLFSPAHGLPYEWSNPFELNRPAPAYFDTGWITHSPSYIQTLASFRILSVPEALVSRADIFLMGQQEFTVFLARYYEEHYGYLVSFESLYQMPNPSAWPDYDGINIYRVHAIK